ncbi:hypothetical protein BSK62_30095, partial [Paenibacillus odorifer]|uniref:condensation domain-containing protein n=1 Tax=Paenibacillus odorifer TaxID=189426 RepID=UPI00097AF3D8
IERMIGLFINTTPVRINCTEDQRVTALLQQVQDAALASESHSHYPLYEIQGLSPLKTGLIDHVLVFENYPIAEAIGQAGETDEAAFAIRDVGVFEQTNYDMTIVLAPGEALSMTFRYNAKVYDPLFIQCMEGHIKEIARQILEDAQRPIASISLVTAEEKQLLLYAFNNLTYAELNARANQLAWTLREQGVGPDRIVAILTERSLELMVGLYAILKAGGAYLPIEPALPAERIRYMLTDSGAEVLLIQPGLDPCGFEGSVLELTERGQAQLEANPPLTIDSRR